MLARWERGSRTPHHQVLDVVRAHPFPSRQSGEGGVQAVHVEQQGAIVALDERGQPTAPAGDRNHSGNLGNQTHGVHASPSHLLHEKQTLTGSGTRPLESSSC